MSGLTGAPVIAEGTQAEPAEAARSDGAPVTSVVGTRMAAGAACPAHGTVSADDARRAARVDKAAAATAAAR
ncbi:hypothetical protein, partial [Mycobacterium sp. UM_CSW]|uniref:hypothetical protein n=1 Tax=Mycobacterium sp. UM_CSW TaxID=1370119 RepID=UPI00126983BF